MKRVIRRGVFETNSSSSHSLTLKRIKGTPKNEIDEDASFEIRSPLAKTIQMLGLIQTQKAIMRAQQCQLTSLMRLAL